MILSGDDSLTLPFMAVGAQGVISVASNIIPRQVSQMVRLYAEGKDRAKVMALAIHPYISGQPHRIKYLEAIYDYVKRFDGVLHWNGEQILDWYKSVAGDKLK